MSDDDAAKNDDGPSGQEKQEADQPTKEEKEKTLIDFRTAVEANEGQQEGQPTGEGGEPQQQSTTDPAPKNLNPLDRKVVRCASCGHFLFEIIAARAYVRVICRQGECKAQNEVTVENVGKKSSLHIEITPKEARQMGTMRY